MFCKAFYQEMPSHIVGMCIKKKNGSTHCKKYIRKIRYGHALVCPKRYISGSSDVFSKMRAAAFFTSASLPTGPGLRILYLKGVQCMISDKKIWSHEMIHKKGYKKHRVSIYIEGCVNTKGWFHCHIGVGFRGLSFLP